MGAILLSDALRLKGVKGPLSKTSVYILLRNDPTVTYKGKDRRIRAKSHADLDRKIDSLLGRKTLEDWVIELASKPVIPFDAAEVADAYVALATRIFISQDRPTCAQDVHEFWLDIDLKANRVNQRADENLLAQVSTYADNLLKGDSK